MPLLPRSLCFTAPLKSSFYFLMFLFLFPHRFLNQAMKMFDATEVVPINFVFFTASAILAGLSNRKSVASCALKLYLLYA